MTRYITADEDRAYFERRGVEAGEQTSYVDCLNCDEVYIDGQRHRCHNRDACRSCGQSPCRRWRALSGSCPGPAS